MVAPHPHRHPIAAPYTPVCSQLLGIGGQGGYGVTGIGVGSQRIGRDMLVKIHNFSNKRIFCSISTADRNGYGDSLRRGRCMPLNPYHLRITARNYNIPYPVAGSHNIESHRGRIVWCQIPAGCQSNGSYYICVHTIFHIRCVNITFRFFGTVIEPNNTDSQIVDNVRV